jgi:5-methyltetrahydropteroyltriglutamate--homocysteine methyltransferase
VLSPPYAKVVELDRAEDRIGVGLNTYFAMARGYQSKSGSSLIDVGSMEMKKWFDTNYHYIVPEFQPNQKFSLTSVHPDELPKPVSEYLEAKAQGIETRPVILGPLSFLLLGKSGDSSKPYSKPSDALVHLDALLSVYIELFSKLKSAGVQAIQVDEPVLCLDLDDGPFESEYIRAYTALRQVTRGVQIMLTTYFGEVRENYQRIIKHLPVDGLHLDATRSQASEISAIINSLPATWFLSLGLVDGRNIWKIDLKPALLSAQEARKILGASRLHISSSCSLLHSPFSIEPETKKLDPEILSWLSFATEKLEEISFLAQACNLESLDLSGSPNLESFFQKNQASLENRRSSSRIHIPAIKVRVENVTKEMLKRQNPYPTRHQVQRKRLSTLPSLFPTTTIGSFPQTKEVRAIRSAYKNKKVSFEEYDTFLRKEIAACTKMQEECGLDVLVHGEFERTDMVEYFGELLQGYTFTSNGWVQSYGSRCVKPPIIYGDIIRPKAMTVEYSAYAQSLTGKPVKGMLTGPVTMLQWSFVRDDQPRSATCFQLALAIRDEVTDLEKAGIPCIQIDEPAIREGLPLRKSDWEIYLKWAIDSFLLSSTGVNDETQIHSHMCYSDFNDIFEAIQRMDVDVLTIENSKSDLKLLRAFEVHGYKNEIGPGLYDIHSPRIPTIEEMTARAIQMLKYLEKETLWINPDCGLKTRGWKETRAALDNLVQVAKDLRSQS